MKKRIFLELDYDDFYTILNSFELTLVCLKTYKKGQKNYDDYLELINRLNLLYYQLYRYKGEFK